MNAAGNSLGRLTAFEKVVLGTVLFTGTTPSLSQLSLEPLADQPQVSISSNPSTGNVVVTVREFRGTNGYLGAQATGTVNRAIPYCTDASYTSNTDTANFTFQVTNDAGTAADSGFHFQLWAFKAGGDYGNFNLAL